MNRLLLIALVALAGLASCASIDSRAKPSLKGTSFHAKNHQDSVSAADLDRKGQDSIHSELEHTKSIWDHAYRALQDLRTKNDDTLGFAPQRPPRRLDDEEPPPAWEAIFVGVLLLVTFAILLLDKIGTDWVLMVLLAIYMASGVISIKEGLAGFASEGLWTVMALFVVAAGIANTGALDWYMILLLGKPKSVASALLRIFVPCTAISAILNNTPIVVIMIPIIQRWARNIGIPTSQLMLPMCYAVVLGGTITFIGSSTNLIGIGYLKQNAPEALTGISIWTLGKYGVPYALFGHVYMLLFSWLLPGAAEAQKTLHQGGEDEEILLGARLTKWSSAAGRTVQRSGLREAGGIYLVSVYRASTGNTHRAVGKDFVLNAGDTLFFAGLVEEFPKFCDEHGLEVVTADSSVRNDQDKSLSSSEILVGTTKESLLSADANLRMRVIYKIIGKSL